MVRVSVPEVRTEGQPPVCPGLRVQLNPAARSSRADLADVSADLAGLTAEVGSKEDTVVLLGRAAAIREELTAESSDAGRRAALAEVLARLGSLQKQTGRSSEAAGTLGRSLKIREALARDHPADDAYRQAVAVLWVLC
jgi:hypothetical protein